MNSAPAENQVTMTMPQLKERGWTQAMVRDLLGDPDQLRPNPRYRSAAPMRLYSADRVTAVEAGEDFTIRVMASKKRSAAAAAAADKRREELLDAVSEITITVPELGEDELARKAIKHRNDVMQFHSSGDLREEFAWADPNKPSSVEAGTLARWKVNYLRHVCTIYDAALEDLYGRVGRDAATDVIRDRVYDVIAASYPALADEARRQSAERKKYRL
ncbi:hypothetical protein [Mycobacterium sp. 94-17]|uniref:hypothetical protein n=1 Tax=Mycobacterium sp. 94-17 TaxID=2986147 RepID=UPI002D1E977C|nr:hypothetical protein [Mycobacterium sp. 94-17]MEB4210983.1 hypothetical protein [Mycobacterium sp. 94-17]